MSWLTDVTEVSALRERTAKSLMLPIGMVNPLWVAFGAAASAGAAWWLMTRWTRPMNLEAILATPAAPPLVEAPAPVADAPAPAADTSVAATPVVEAQSPAEPEAVPATVIEPAPEVLAAEPAPRVDDDLTRLTGVGPRTAAALAERGVTTFAKLAAWTEADMAAFDAEMNLKGRSARDAWLAQARRLATEA